MGMQTSLGLLAGGILAAAASHASPLNYQFTNLGTLGGMSSSAAAISNSGQIVGTASNGKGLDRAFMWSKSSITDLGVIGGGVSQAYAINNAGQVAGVSSIYGNFDYQSATWSGGGPSQLNGLGGSYSYALAINNAGQHAGYSEGSNGATHAVRWTGGVASDLGTLGGFSSYGYGINDSGAVVGSASTLDENLHATRWDGNSATDLGTLGGSYSWAYAINSAGQAVGYANTGNDAATRATIWNGNAITELTSGGWSNSTAFGINSGGAAVGTVYNQTGEGHAALWLDGSMIDLNQFLGAEELGAGWVLRQANGINDSGWIVGYAYNTQSGISNAFLLSAVPEPGQWLMLSTGLVLLGWRARRRVVPPTGIEPVSHA